MALLDAILVWLYHFVYLLLASNSFILSKASNEFYSSSGWYACLLQINSQDDIIRKPQQFTGTWKENYDNALINMQHIKEIKTTKNVQKHYQIVIIVATVNLFKF